MPQRLQDFPEELLLVICVFMGPLDLARALRCCQSLHQAAATDDLWRVHCDAIFARRETPEEGHLQLFRRVLPQLAVVAAASSARQKKSPLALLLRRILAPRKRPRYTNHILACVPAFATLAKALKAGKSPKGTAEGPYVLLSPGLYEEANADGSLVVSKSCLLVGAAQTPEEVQVGVPVELLKGRSVVRGVEFKCNVTAKAPTLFEDCVFREGLDLRGGVGHVVRRCRVLEARAHGITVHPGAGATIEGCEISGCHGTGVDVQTAVPDSVTILQCDIHTNANGIVVSKPCNCQIVQNRIHGNHAPGINVKADGTATISQNKVYDGNWGIVLKDQGTGEVVDNECYHNTHSAICLQTSGSPRIFNNFIHHETRGIVVTGKVALEDGDEAAPPTALSPAAAAAGGPVIEGNVFEANARSAISVKNGSNPVIVRNRIHSGRWGIIVQKRAWGLIVDNDIAFNSRPGIGIKTHAHPEVERNRIHDGGAMGVMCNENGAGVIRNNEFFGNSHSAISIKSGGNPRVVGNKIHDEKRGIAVSDGGSGLIENNDISAFSKTGLTIKSGGCPTVRHNRIHGGKQGLTVHEQGEGIVEGNLFYDNSTLNLGLKKGGRTVIRSNRQGRLCHVPPGDVLRDRAVAPAAPAAPSADAQPRSAETQPEPTLDPPEPEAVLESPEAAQEVPNKAKARREVRDAESDSDDSDESDAEGEFLRV